MKLLLIVVCVTLIGYGVYGKSVSNDVIERMMMDEVIKLSHEDVDVKDEKTDSQNFFDSINVDGKLILICPLEIILIRIGNEL